VEWWLAQEVVIRFGSQFRRGPPRKGRTTPSQSQRMVFHPSVNTSTEYSHVTGTRYLTSVLVREYA